MKNVLNFLIVLIVILCVTTSCSVPMEPAPDMYKSFLCYDYHLACLKTERTVFDYQPTEDAYLDARRFRFKKIKGESETQFLFTQVTHGYTTHQKFVFQNPDDYVDVWTDWSIKKIDFFYVDLRRPRKQNGTATIPDRVIDSMKNKSVLTAFNEVIIADGGIEKYYKPEGYEVEYYDTETINVRFYLRVYFNESENIVWDTDVTSLYSKESDHRIITMDIGKTLCESGFKQSKNLVLDGSTCALYDWLDALLDGFEDFY